MRCWATLLRCTVAPVLQSRSQILEPSIWRVLLICENLNFNVCIYVSLSTAKLRRSLVFEHFLTVRKLWSIRWTIDWQALPFSFWLLLSCSSAQWVSAATPMSGWENEIDSVWAIVVECEMNARFWWFSNKWKEFNCSIFLQRSKGPYFIS